VVRIARQSPRADLDDAAIAESATVTRQGIWVFLSSIFSSGLGFLFWVVAARLFSAEDVGVAGSLVSLASLATALATVGLDIGFVRFAPRVRQPLRLLRDLMIITGCLGVVVGGILPLALLSFGHLESAALFTLVGIIIFLTVAQAWNDLTNGAIMAAQKSHILTIANAAYGLIKLAAVILVIGMGVVGLTAAYAFPAAILLIINFSAIRHLWPSVNPGADPHSIRALAPISTGNWISGLAYSLPPRLGPSLMLLFLPAASVAYFFIALQLAEVLNYMSEAFSKSLFAHGSRKDRLTHSITSHVRGLLSLILIPAVAIGIGGDPRNLHRSLPPGRAHPARRPESAARLVDPRWAPRSGRRTVDGFEEAFAPRGRGERAVISARGLLKYRCPYIEIAPRCITCKPREDNHTQWFRGAFV
jgi:O-antigen/teichoic acid export membrane protein